MGNALFLKTPINVVTVSYKIKRSNLFIIRLAMLIILIGLVAWNCIIHADEFYRYFTLWGLMITTVYFIVIQISYFQGLGYNVEYEAMQLRYHSKFNQVMVIIFESAWAAEFVITAVFWCILLPVLAIYENGHPEYKSTVTTADLIYDGFVHLMPFGFLLVDLILLSITFTPVQIVWSLGYGILFACMDCGLVLTGHPPAYPVVLEWDGYMTALTLCGMMLLLALGFYVGFRITFKNKVVKDDILIDYYIPEVVPTIEIEPPRQLNDDTQQ